MDRQIHLSAEQFVERMHGEFEQTMRRVADAVNQAPDGFWINGSEVQVLEIMNEFRRKAFETALQMRVDAAEGAFSPGGFSNPQKATEQGKLSTFDAVRQRPSVAASAALPQRQSRKRHAG